MEIIELLLSPIVWTMTQVLKFYQQLVSSTGFSIVLMSFTFSLLLIPLQRWGNRIEKKLSGKIQQIDAEIKPLKLELKGEALFLETEKIYSKHNYHPIHSIGMGASFLVMLPVLLSAIILFTGNGILSGQSYLIISDLSKPDGLLGPVNLLPVLMFAVTVVDAKLRFKGDKKSQYRFYFISIILLVIVYNLAAGLVLYWTSSNIMSLILSRFAAR